MYIQQADTHQFTLHYETSIFINYISEYQLSHAVERTPSYAYYTCQLGSYVIETDRWRHCLCLRWVPYIPGTTAQVPGGELGRTARYPITITV